MKTRREIPTSVDPDTVDFTRGGGLVPVVAQDSVTGDILMLGWADREALDATLATGHLHFHSRSRGALWMKGETSGNTLALVSLHADCDRDALLARVRPAGPTCHTGERSCFGEGISPSRNVDSSSGDGPEPGDGMPDGGASALQRLDAVLASRASERPEGSYTVRLLDDTNLRLKKLGEESAELVAALATGDRSRAIEEAADVVYHVLVALRAEAVGADALLAALERRAG